MKTATAFLVAVTVFASVSLESSAAPNPLISTLTARLSGTVKGLGTLAGGLINDAGKVTEKVVATGVKTADGLVKVIINTAAKDTGALIQFLSKVLNGLQANLEEVTEECAALGGETGEEVKKSLIKVQNTLKELIGAAEKTIKAVAEGANDIVKKLEVIIKNLFAKLKAEVEGVNEILDKVPEDAENAVALVIASVKGALVKVDEVAKVILSKLAEALKSKTAEVVDGAKKLDKVALAEYVEEKIKSCNEALGAFNKVVEECSATATDEQKEFIAKVVEWLKKGFAPVVEGIHEELREAVEVNDLIKLKKVTEKILETIKTTKVQVSEMIKTQLEEIKEALVKFILEIVVAEAEQVVIVLKNQYENNAV